jgi:hypothetical protein
MYQWIVRASLSDLGHNHDLLAGQIQLLDGLAEYDLRLTIRIGLPVVSFPFRRQLEHDVRRLRTGSRWPCRRSGCHVRS